MRKYVNREQIAFMNRVTNSLPWFMGEMIKSVHDSKRISSGMLDLERSRAGRLIVGSLLPARSWTLVQIQAEAYILTLFPLLRGSSFMSRTRDPYLSIHVPGNLAPTLEAEKPFFSKTEVYHGFKPADRRITLPPIFIARFSAWTWVWAWSSPGLNQSMLSMTCIKSQCLSRDV